jgi:oligopeptide/dipeptide ABC transporter ATP-binding protein
MIAACRKLVASGTGVAALVILSALLVLAVIGPLVWGGAAQHIDASVVGTPQGPSMSHLFGTNDLGQDILARTMDATRLSLELACLASLIAICIGIPLGLASSVLGRSARRLINAFIGGAIAFPALLTAMFVGTIIGIGETGAVVGIGIAFTPLFARLTQTLAAAVASLDYVAAARTLGVGRGRVMFRHILPNVAEPLVVTASMSVAYSLIGLSTLSFLGLGVRPPAFDWGALLQAGLQDIYENPLAAIAPAAFIAIAGIGFSLLGESVSHAFGGQTSSRLGLKRARQMARLPKLLGPARGSGVEDHAAGPSGLEHAASTAALVEAEDLEVRFPGVASAITPVRGVSLRIGARERIGIVGESGSGKSLTVMAIAQLLSYPASVRWRSLRLFDNDVAATSPRRLRQLLGTRLAMVFQDPLNSLNPLLRIRVQMTEASEVLSGMSASQAAERAATNLLDVGIAEPRLRLRNYPHQLSGGMRQRVTIAMGLMETPSLIIADEPTTALDVTVQRQILELLVKINEESGAALLLISHDIAVISNVCERVVVMYAGRIVEELPSARLVESAAHHYTRALVEAVPDMSTDRHQELISIPGRPPPVEEDPVGCAFAPRCPAAAERCVEQRPELTALESGHRVACWYPHRPESVEASFVATASRAGDD